MMFVKQLACMKWQQRCKGVAFVQILSLDEIKREDALLAADKAAKAPSPEVHQDNDVSLRAFCLAVLCRFRS